MRKRTTRKAAPAKTLVTPMTPVSDAAAERSPTLSPAKSPEALFDFKIKGLTNIASSSKKQSNEKLLMPTGLSPQRLQTLKSVSTISDLKNMATLNLDGIKRKLEMSHSEILKNIEASQGRLRKRHKMQTQACQQVMDEVEKEYKKISERIKDGQEAMTASYAEFIAETQASASRSPLYNIGGHHIHQQIPVMGTYSCSRAPRLPFPPPLTTTRQGIPVSILSPLPSKTQSLFTRLNPVLATLNSPKGFGPKKITKTKKPKKDYASDDDNQEEEDEAADNREEGVIPEIVTNRMISRMGLSVGIPLFIGLLFFPFFYYLKVGLKIDVPTWVPFIVSFIFFGTALLGVSYGIVSSSWDPMREGSLLGWNEAKKNWPVFWRSIWGGSKEK
ncbi:hypothetical protein F511_00544 [Dorcoceras hygrometricum]|uniref:Protein PAM68, chloroplastic n=1 Tax=Dorcoceras hygrometricum TaxID=472368 RepID=A0A2Z7BBW1_9LAMI|nr:hypothetical protein F511_00544 [Dorcoceras hygrometricum]